MAVTDQQFIPTVSGLSGSLEAGAVVAGRYRIVSKLGEGGMGAVYRAVQEPLGREVALKVIAPALATDADAVERFRREAKAASSLSHPHIVTVFDFGTDAGQLFIAMELITGEGLDDVVKRGPMPARRAIPILRAVSTALAEAHARGIVHRDLKPPNVMLTSTSTQQDVVKVVDFGIARMADGGGRTLTQTGAVVGTPGYVAPELFDGAQPSASSDLYALGVVAYELLGGTAPFPGGTPREILKAVLFGEPLPLRNFAREVPESLEALVMGLLERDPAKRPVSARDVDAALAAIQSAPVVLPPLPPLPVPLLPSSSPGSRPTPSTAVIMTEAMPAPPRSDRPARPAPPPAVAASSSSSVPQPAVAPSSRQLAPSRPAERIGGVPAWVVAVGLVVGGSVVATPFVLDGLGAPNVTVTADGSYPERTGGIQFAITPDGATLNGVDLEALRQMTADPRLKDTLAAEAGAALTDPESTDEDKRDARALLSFIAQPATTTTTTTTTTPTPTTPDPAGGLPDSVRTTLLARADEAMRDHSPVVAEANLKKLLEYLPDDIEAHRQLGNVYAAMENDEASRFHRLRFLTLAPPDHPRRKDVSLLVGLKNVTETR